jgi:hypothetical protein
VAELRRTLEGAGFELRTVGGRKGQRPLSSIERDLLWADVLVVWGDTPLDHALSIPYTSRAREGPFRTPMFTAKGGVEAVCRALERHARRPRR